jgi:hypothetical protein
VLLLVLVLVLVLETSPDDFAGFWTRTAMRLSTLDRLRCVVITRYRPLALGADRI